MYREQSGAAALSGRDLPTDEALAAYANVTARAAEYKDSGAFPDARMDQLRATAYLDLITGVTADTRIAHGHLSADTPDPEATPDTDADVGPDEGGDPDDGDPGDSGGSGPPQGHGPKMALVISAIPLQGQTTAPGPGGSDFPAGHLAWARRPPR